MTEFFIFVYATLAIFVIQAMTRNHRAQRPSPQIVTVVGWGLFSLSSTFSLLLSAVALALALGMQMPLPDAFHAPLF